MYVHKSTVNQHVVAHNHSAVECTLPRHRWQGGVINQLHPLVSVHKICQQSRSTARKMGIFWGKAAEDEDGARGRMKDSGVTNEAVK